MKHAQPTCHGPRLLDNGEVEFRLWAPTARSVSLLLEEAKPLAMAQWERGWWNLTVPAPKGARYHFLINDELKVPDPASRFQPDDVHGQSELVEPADFDWPDDAWQGRPWEEAVIYELHPGCFSPEGTFAGIEAKLDDLKALGITAVELMPVSDFEGTRGWGYDGVLPYAPDAAYGRPEDLKRLIASAHARGLMVFLDVVYNHFGPSGNYLHAYAGGFFTDRHQTPWGAAIDFTEPEVRDYFIDNALYWLNEYRFDGLRFDAVHAICDQEQTHFLEELATRLRSGSGKDRHIHLVLENDANQAHYLNRKTSQPLLYTAQWNDDFHHVMHVLITGEKGGYYKDYAEDTLARLGRCLTQGFVYQGEASPHRGGEQRGEPSSHLPSVAFVNFLQNHDQIGNRAMGERISQLASPAALELATVILFLSPAIPLIYMGEEWLASSPFLFFCDFHDELADAVREGRRREFASFPQFSAPEKRKQIPDPNAKSTFTTSKLNWDELKDPRHRNWRDFTAELLALRQQYIVPLLRTGKPEGSYQTNNSLLQVRWHFPDGTALQLAANFSNAPLEATNPDGRVLFGETSGSLGPWKGYICLSGGR